MWRERVTLVSDHIFPGLSNYNNSDSDYYFKKGTEVFSHLPLQCCLYFNFVFFPFWLTVLFSMLPLRYADINGLYRFILVTFLFAVIAIECLRLYMGYIGNLKEKVPEMAGFWLLTILLQTPLQLFLLLCPEFKSSLLEKIVQIIMCLFLVLQLIFGFFALRYSAKHSVQAFHLTNYVEQKDS